MKLFLSVGIFGSLVLTVLAGCSNDAPVAQQVLLAAATPARVGTVLNGSYQYSDADGDGEKDTLQAWLRDGQPIDGANQNEYIASAQDSGKKLQFQVTPAAASGTSPGTAVASTGITIENSAPSISGLVIGGSVNGQAYTSLTLTASYSFQDADGEGGSTYQWYSGTTPIGGATLQIYVVKVADIGKALTVQVTPKDNFVPALSGTSVVSLTITPVNLAPEVSNVVVNGKAVNQAGEVLSVSYIYFDHEKDAESATGSQFCWREQHRARSG